MSQSTLNWIANFIWSIADDVLRDVYVRGKENDDGELADLVDALAAEWGPGPHLDFNAFLRAVEASAGFRFYKRHAGLLADELTQVNPDAAPVIADVVTGKLDVRDVPLPDLDADDELDDFDDLEQGLSGSEEETND
jgi:hypothetical protein